MEPYVQPFGLADCPHAFMGAICVPDGGMVSDPIGPGHVCVHVGHRGYPSLQEYDYPLQVGTYTNYYSSVHQEH